MIVPPPLSLFSTPRRIRRVKSVTPQSNSSSTPGTPKRASSIQNPQPPALSVVDISSLLAGKGLPLVICVDIFITSLLS